MLGPRDDGLTAEPIRPPVVFQDSKGANFTTIQSQKKMTRKNDKLRYVDAMRATSA